jgi:hypothetical protein
MNKNLQVAFRLVQLCALPATFTCRLLNVAEWHMHAWGGTGRAVGHGPRNNSIVVSSVAGTHNNLRHIDKFKPNFILAALIKARTARIYIYIYIFFLQVLHR